jgi:hypothetical protein
MQPSEALGVAAQVAVTLAGFAGIVVVFRPQSVREWSALDRFRLTLLLLNSAMPLGFALFGMLLLSVDPAPLSIWRWCSGFAFAGEVMAFVSMPNPRRRISTADLQTVNKFIFYGLAALATASAALQVFNFAVWNRFWPFFAAIFVHLSAAVIQFLRLLLLPPRDSSNA